MSTVTWESLRRSALVRSREEPAWARPALFGLLGLTAVLLGAVAQVLFDYTEVLSIKVD